MSRCDAQHPFHQELEQVIEVLNEAIVENWEVKGNSPGLKPILTQVVLKAVVLGQYNDNLPDLMLRLFLYNKFTVTKLIKRTIWQGSLSTIPPREAQKCLRA
ncbi:hypothetical protein BD311DRAFT_803220 [Dichomitus squalens]|uniref:Ubinuclein middle domain-containing protein n=1 Tax=Dichomitus squalens TaxID=114155 RepID=A0A4Q9N2T6_9APHY|nr:hypothetical protein BD311DRAFT_803220 [Dichomitus squalens]